MRLLVTGAIGFIGYHLCLELSKKGNEVFGIDNLSRGLVERINKLEDNNVKFSVADVCNYDNLVKLMEKIKPEVVVHLAALISVQESIEKPSLYMLVNAEGTKNLVLASNLVRVKRFVYISSAAVYGNPIFLPINEDHPTNPISPYGSSKLLGENYVKNLFNGEKGSVILRLFNVYGKGQNLEYAGVIVKFIERLKEGKPPIVFGNGEQTRDFVHVDDVVEAILKASESSKSEVINIGSGIPTRIKDLAYILIKMFGKDFEPIFEKQKPGDIKHSYADISKARRVINWYPRIKLEEGLLKTINSNIN